MTRDSIREGLVELALRVERIADFDTQEAVDLNKALHDLLPEPKCVQPPNYLRSIDAAMSLVPEGWAICTGHGVEGEQGSYFTILTYLDPETESETVREATGDNWAATVCAAALGAKVQS